VLFDVVPPVLDDLSRRVLVHVAGFDGDQLVDGVFVIGEVVLAADAEDPFAEH
jgi:hypothetical protein